MSLPQTVNASASPEVQMNSNALAQQWSFCYANDTRGNSGLTRRYSGDRWGSFNVTQTDHTFGASTTTYVSAKVSDGTFDFSTSNTNFNDTTNYKRIETVVTSGSAVTGTTDYRGGPGGVHGSGGGTSSSSVTAWKTVVRAASTANGTLASAFENGDTLDGVTLATGDRILLKNQSSGTENGIYTVNASGAPTRATDADAGSELINAVVPVSEGTANADTIWMCTTNATITLGSTSLTFTAFISGGVAWGAITGTLSSQTDLQAALDLKQARSPAVQSVSSSATVTPTFSNDLVKITAQAAGLTLANPSGTAIEGLGIAIRIKDNGTARSISYGTQYRAIGVTLPVTTVISKTVYLGCVWNDTDTKFDVVAVAQEA